MFLSRRSDGRSVKQGGQHEARRPVLREHRASWLDASYAPWSRSCP